MFYKQKEFQVKCEWGLSGLKALLDVSDIIIIIDILSFSTCVDLITSKNGYVYPFLYNDDSAKNFSNNLNAILAEKRSKNSISLSPSSLKNIEKDLKIVLPSPNGSTISFASKGVKTFCACFRNYKEVAKKVQELGTNITIIPAGEKWEDGLLRPAIEDLLAAGAIISELKNLSLSSESKIALQSFANSKNNLFEVIKNSSSGKELIEKGFEEDLKIACQINSSNAIPFLNEDGFYYNLNK